MLRIGIRALSERRLTDLTILCRGVPVGRAPLLLRSDEHGAIRLDVGTAVALPAFDATIGDAVRRYEEAEAAWIGLKYPEAAGAEARVKAAWSAVCELWATLELQDERGTILPIPVDGFMGQSLSANFDEVPASVLARLRDEYGGEKDADPPPAQ